MNILVTVGTTPFDALISAIDHQLTADDFTVTCQIASGGYQPTTHAFIRFSEQFAELVNQADMVIAHGGAATVFELLEAGKKLLLVPNLSRIDKHQQDLAGFVEQQGYGMVCWSLDTLAECVRNCARQDFKVYQKEPFFMADSILQYFNIGFDINPDIDPDISSDINSVEDEH